LPGWAFVHDYVIAFYLPDKDYLQWILDHADYSLEQYIHCLLADG
jgi:hypothetical protein